MDHNRPAEVEKTMIHDNALIYNEPQNLGYYTRLCEYKILRVTVNVFFWRTVEFFGLYVQTFKD